jgi:hypothetical protein
MVRHRCERAIPDEHCRPHRSSDPPEVSDISNPAEHGDTDPTDRYRTNRFRGALELT